MHHITCFVNIHSLKLICRPDEQSVEIDTSLPWSVKVDRAQVKSKNRGRHDYRTLLTIANSAVKSSPALPIYRQSWVISFWKSELRIKRPKTLLQKTWKLKVVSGSSAPQWRTSQRISKSLLKVFLFGKCFSCRGIFSNFISRYFFYLMYICIVNCSHAPKFSPTASAQIYDGINLKWFWLDTCSILSRIKKNW